MFMCVVQNGFVKLPDLSVTDKNDTFHAHQGNSFPSFRLMAVAVRQDEWGNPLTLDNIPPAMSAKFVVGVGGLGAYEPALVFLLSCCGGAIQGAGISSLPDASTDACTRTFCSISLLRRYNNMSSIP